ncbi:MAG TPA: hypothetical protein VMT54_13095 [Candidatus Cybelea sp.]|nr:hypothetical protein [Candidatus Cybelea sp.]
MRAPPFRGRQIFAVALTLTSAGSTLGAFAEDAKLQVTKAAWTGYQSYLAGVTDQRHTFFAISKDGQIWGQSGCPKDQCPADDALKASAIQRCQQFSASVPCLIFAEDKTILVPYQVKDYTAYGQ